MYFYLKIDNKINYKIIIITKYNKLKPKDSQSSVAIFNLCKNQCLLAQICLYLIYTLLKNTVHKQKVYKHGCVYC